MNKLTVYHYTNNEAYKSMQTKGIDGYSTSGFNNFTGIIPSRRFISLSRGKDLPDKAYDGVIEGLLEPEPKSWTDNEEFPRFFGYLMHDICRREKVILLSFELNKNDEAYIVDRAHVERELYRQSKGKGEPTRRSMNAAVKKYWNSRVPALEYNGNYDAPQLAIWSGIELDRLKVEWTKNTNDVWKRILNNNWY
jgi:hypothetical protein